MEEIFVHVQYIQFEIAFIIETTRGTYFEEVEKK